MAGGQDNAKYTIYLSYCLNTRQRYKCSMEMYKDTPKIIQEKTHNKKMKPTGRETTNKK